MDAIAMLRAKALAYAPKFEYPLCLEDGLRLEIAAIQRQLIATRTRRGRLVDSGDVPESLAEQAPTVRIDREIADLTAQLEEVMDQARPDSIVLIFRRLPATADSAAEGEKSYDEVEREHTDDKGAVDYKALGGALLPLCYSHAENMDGHDLGLSWADMVPLFDAADWEGMRHGIIGRHNTGAAVPFDPRNSGQPETT